MASSSSKPTPTPTPSSKELQDKLKAIPPLLNILKIASTDSPADELFHRIIESFASIDFYDLFLRNKDQCVIKVTQLEKEFDYIIKACQKVIEDRNISSRNKIPLNRIVDVSSAFRANITGTLALMK